MLLLLVLSPLAFAQDSDYFNSQVSEELSVTGSECGGGGRFSTRTCTGGEWYVTLNHKSLGSLMFLATLDRVQVMSPSTISFYNISPITPVSAETLDFVRTHWVRFDLSGETKVLRIK